MIIIHKLVLPLAHRYPDSTHFSLTLSEYPLSRSASMPSRVNLEKVKVIPCPYVRKLKFLLFVKLHVTVFSKQEQPRPLPAHLRWGFVVPTMVEANNCIHTYKNAYYHYLLNSNRGKDWIWKTRKKYTLKLLRFVSVVCQSIFCVYKGIMYLFILQDSHQRDTVTPTFFEEAPTYWIPSSECAAIYQQLADNRFREIIRDQIQWELLIYYYYYHHVFNILVNIIKNSGGPTRLRAVWRSTQGGVALTKWIYCSGHQDTERNIFWRRYG